MEENIHKTTRLELLLNSTYLHYTNVYVQVKS